MKIVELIETESTQQSTGTYVGVKLDDSSLDSLVEFAKSNDIPNPLKRSDFHSTVVYSRKHLPDFDPVGNIDEPWIATPKGFDVWESKPNAYKDESTFCLVMEIDCPDMVKRHDHAREDHGATYDFDEYKPHITISYDVGKDFDKSNLEWSGEPLKISNEYSEELNLNKKYD